MKGFTMEWLAKNRPENAKAIYNRGSTSKERSCAKQADLKPQAVKKNKYRNRKVIIDGFEFDSVKEGNRWIELKQMQEDGKITNLMRQQKLTLHVNGNIVCQYYPDFQYLINGKEIIEDVKSAITKKNPVYRLKKKLVKAVYGIEIIET